MALANDATVRVVVDAVDHASPIIDRMNLRLAGQLRRMSMNLLIVGGVVTGFTGLAVKAALDQRIAVSRLDLALQALGTSYATNRDEVDATVDKYSKLTAISKKDLFDALAGLVTKTGDFKVALEGLPAAAVLAKGMGIPLKEAADLIGDAFLGDKGALTKLQQFGVGFNMQAHSWPGIITAVRSKFEPEIDAMVSPLDRLKLSMTNMFAGIGMIILPQLQPIIDKLAEVIGAISDWTKTHPELTRVIALSVVVFGGLLSLFAIFLGITAIVIASTVAIQMAFALLAGSTGIGLVLIGLGALIVLSIFLAVYWDRVMDRMKEATRVTVNGIIGGFEFLFNAVVTWLNWMLGLKELQWLLGKAGVPFPVIPRISLPRIEGPGPGLGVVLTPEAELEAGAHRRITPEEQAFARQRVEAGNILNNFNFDFSGATITNPQELQRMIQQTVRDALRGGGFPELATR